MSKRMLAGHITQKEPLELAVKRLAEFFRILSNPRRILIIEELQETEKDVSSLAASLQLQQSAVSKHLAILRTHKLVQERKDGRNIYYRLSRPEMASWIFDGITFASTNRDNTDFSVPGAEQANHSWNRTLEEGKSK